MTALVSSLQQLLCFPSHEDCTTCQDTGFTPSETGRECLHRHEKLFPRVTHSFADRLRETNSRFSTDNDGLNAMLLAGHILLESLFSIADKRNTLLSHEQCLQAVALIQQGYSIPDAADFVIDRATSSANSSTEPAQPTEQFPEQALWYSLADPLKARVSETNYELWLSTSFITEINHPTIVVGVPNTFFQEYLTEHYTEVIQEELVKLSELSKVEFVVEKRPPPVPAPAQEAAPTPEPVTLDIDVEVLPKEPLTPRQQQLKKRREKRLQLADNCTFRSNGKPELFRVMYADVIKLLQAEEEEEDRLARHQESFERWLALKEQRPKDSAFDSTKPIDRKQQRKMLTQLERDLDKDDTPKPTNSS